MTEINTIDRPNPVGMLATFPALALSACAASPPAHGNAKGRVVQWFATTAKAVQAEADRHYQQYGNWRGSLKCAPRPAGTCQ
jgi:hypothetical protein